jgi:4-amino-4-deoxy-L-arabinose transferase-like glycosyltransferase
MSPRVHRFLERLVDPLIALLLATTFVALLLHTSRDLGYARDEGFYFRAASDYKRWFDLLFQDPARAFERTAVDSSFRSNHEHPVLVKSLFALSVKFLHGTVIAEGGTAFRFPGMVLSSAGVAVTYLWGRRAIGRLAGIVAAVLLAMQPAMFYHSHLACFDVPVMTMWLVTTYAYWRTLHGGGVGWVLFTGLLYGLQLNTKHNAWLLPPALVLHFLLTRGPRGLRRDLGVGTLRAPAALFAMATIGPVVFYLTWPWLWFDTGKRLAEYVAFHVNHDYYNMEFLGVTYFRPPMPLAYAWVLTAATVPSITLVLFATGLVQTVRGAPFGKRARALPAPARRELASALSTRVLWLLCIGTSYAPWLSPGTPIFGGTKHWITAYPFLCLFAGVGFQWALGRATSVLPPVLARLRVPEVLLSASVVAGPTYMTLHAHPYGLSAYVPLVGGQAGGASLGLNRSFWGYTTGSVAGYLNQHAPRGAQIYVHDTAMDSWDRFLKDGRIRKDLRGTLTLSASELALYHHEQHMQRVEYQLWVDYGTVAPAAIGAFDGVPIVWVYRRPKAPFH